MILLIAIAFIVLETVFATWGRDYLPRRPLHLLPGTGFYAAWRRATAPPVKSFWDNAVDLPPGVVSIVTDRRSGNQYALMHLDDFDHIAGLSNLQRRELQVTVSRE